MSFFDQPYYVLSKAHMAQMGIWPEQSTYVRRTRLLTVVAITMTIAGPMVIGCYVTRGDIGTLMRGIPNILIGIGIYGTALRYIQHFDEIKLSFKNIERHWEMLKNTSAVIILDRYAERGRRLIVYYSIFVYIALTLYLLISLSPTILDFVHPLNQTRPKIYIYINAEYGFDVDKYYWFILAHQYIVTIVAVRMMIAMESMYFLWVIHACALFEVVGFNLKLIGSKYTASKETAMTPNDWSYKKMCDCITVHEEAISFAGLVENICAGPSTVVVGTVTIGIIFTGVQAVINFKHPDVLVHLATHVVTQVIHLFINSIAGQELIDHSQKIHTTAYDMDWQNMSVKAQKLLIPILIRSNKPCCITARQVYVLSLETFGSTIRAAMSYLTIFAQLF